MKGGEKMLCKNCGKFITYRPICVKCGSAEVYPSESGNCWHCHYCDDYFDCNK